DDGTFGFEDQHWSAGERERAWVPAGRYSVPRTESAEGALREAMERVCWLAKERTASDEYRLDALDVSAAPKWISGLPVVCFSVLDKRHRPTGKTKHHAAGETLYLPAALAICQES